MNNYSPLTEAALSDKLLSSCRSGQINLLKQIIKNDFDTIYSMDTGNLFYRMGLTSCSNGKTSIIKYLIESSPFQNRINREHYITEYFKISCENGHLKTVEYLSKDLHVQRSNPAILFSIGLTNAAKDGRLNIIKYLLKEFKYLLNEDVIKNGNLTNTACEYGEVPILKYLHSINVLHNDNIHEHSDCHFRAAYENNNFDVVKYLIFDLNLDKTDDIAAILKEKPNKEIEKMFMMRDLNSNLKSEMSINQEKNKKLKV
jgi:hypothetical protein